MDSSKIMKLESAAYDLIHAEVLSKLLMDQIDDLLQTFKDKDFAKIHLCGKWHLQKMETLNCFLCECLQNTSEKVKDGFDEAHAMLKGIAANGKNEESAREAGTSTDGKK